MYERPSDVANPMDLSGKVAIVVGGAGIIGTSISQQLAANGAAVVLMGRRVEETTQVATDIIKAGGKAIAVIGDTIVAEDVKRCVGAAIAAFGGIDILVHNVGGRNGGDFLSLTQEQFDDTWARNVNGPTLMCQAVLPSMIERGEGRIVLTSSIASLGVKGQGNYAASKAGLEGLTRTLSVEFAPLGITTNALMIGLMETSDNRGSTNEELVLGVPVRRKGKPIDVGATAAFFASPGSSYISGSVIMLTGGRTSVE